MEVIIMNGKQKTIVVISAIAALLITTCVTASTTGYTPLYTARMEQASSEMSFLPTAVHEFTYTVKGTFMLSCDTGNCCGGVLATHSETCYTCEGDTCDALTCSTCPGQFTCDDTCALTCENTCGPTCLYTCSPTCLHSCQPTCEITCLICDSQ